MNELMTNRENFTSLELVELINKFREEEGNRNPLLHKNFIAVIKDEFEEEIRELKIQLSSQSVEMPNGGKREYPMYILTLSQSKQVLLRESKFVRKAIIKYIEEIENKLNSVLSKKDKLLLDILHSSTEEERTLAVNRYQIEYVKPLEEENEVQAQKILEYEPKASYYDDVLACKDVLPITVIAKDFGLSGRRMNEILHENGIQYKMSNTWLLYSKHQDKGYTKTKTTKFERPDGTQGMNVHTFWTQKGRLFIYELMKRNGILPLIEREEQ